MSIAAKGSSGVFAECPHCHASIMHGFQLCSKCGRAVDAEQQQELRTTLGKNFAIFAVTSAFCIMSVLYISYQYIER